MTEFATATAAPHSAVPGSPPTTESTRADAARLGVVVLQLLVIAWICREFRIENPAFYNIVVPAAVVGAIVNHLLPLRWRVPFFALLSLGVTWAVFGGRQGAWLVGLALGLITLCRLPIAWGARVALLLVAAVGLGMMRGGVWQAPWTGALWPILGSMFMFRLIAYMYDARHAKEPVTWWQAIAYFLCLPNVVFPLFPVIDFATFRRTHYDRPATAIYEEGVVWMARGLAHLILYRLVYARGTLAPEQVATLSDLVRYLLANFGLYLRVSGQFHLIVGMLHLFGFRLPETHRLFYLASSFTDFWRRINIYWKDFMQKVVYRPATYRVKRYGETVAVVVGTLSVFATTWFMHSYQWFWLLGEWLLSPTDALFWGILAVLLVVNSLWEMRRGRARTLGGPRWSWPAALRHAGATVATFSIICFLWGLWTASSVQEFAALLSVRPPTTRDVGVLLAALGAVGLCALAAYHLTTRPAALAPRVTSRRSFAVLAPLVLLVLAANPRMTLKLPRWLGEPVLSMRDSELNATDAAKLQRGYYERLVGVNRFNGQLWEVYSKRERADDEMARLRIVRSRPDALQLELTPRRETVLRGGAFHTNRWRMRDKDYAQVPPPNTVRIAMLGQSYVMGSGVADDDVFEAIVEDRLNRELSPKTGLHYEILNFGVSKYSLQQQLLILRNGRVFSFRPDYVFLVGHEVDPPRILQYQYEMLEDRGAMPEDSLLRALYSSNDVTQSMTEAEVVRLVSPRIGDLTQHFLNLIAAECRAHDVPALWAFIPTPYSFLDQKWVPILPQMARQAGFRVIDFPNPYVGLDEKKLAVAEWDRHPNAEGHRLIAKVLYDVLSSRPELQAKPAHVAP
ncbi:MAG: hypothetical protein ABI877_06460 [Gemmatimonadaceae bacterium]